MDIRGEGCVSCGKENVLGIWNCLMEGTEVRRMSSGPAVELKFQSLMVSRETALELDTWL